LHVVPFRSVDQLEFNYGGNELLLLSIALIVIIIDFGWLTSETHSHYKIVNKFIIAYKTNILNYFPILWYLLLSMPGSIQLYELNHEYTKQILSFFSFIQFFNV